LAKVKCTWLTIVTGNRSGQRCCPCDLGNGVGVGTKPGLFEVILCV